MKKFAVFVVALTVFSFVPTAQAATINYSTGGVAYNTTALTGYATSGNDMVGMSVTAKVLKVSNGAITDYTEAWGNLGSNNYGVRFIDSSQSDFDLVLGATEDTYGGTWAFDFDIHGTTYRLLSLTFDGVPGNTVFDRTEPDQGTPGSAQGWDFDGFSNWNGTIQAYYFNPVGLGATAPVGDIFAGFRATFVDGLPEGENYSFIMDTDNASTALVPQAPVPEPASMLLLGSGLIGLAGAARRKLRK